MWLYGSQVYFRECGGLASLCELLCRGTSLAAVVAALGVVYIFMTYIFMAYIVMTYIFMAYIVMTYIFMAYIVMAYIFMAYIVMTYIFMAYIVMAYIFMAYIVMTRCCSCGAGRANVAVWIHMN